MATISHSLALVFAIFIGAHAHTHTHAHTHAHTRAHIIPYTVNNKVVQMAVNKFGLAEVQQWNFEVWNELWGMAGGDHTPPCTSQPCIGSTYMQLYNASAVGVKAVHPSLKIGGPATEHINTQNFLSQAKAMNTPVDFVSSHNYPTGNRGDGSGCPQGPTMWTPDCFYDRVTAARGKIPADIPFFITEYSVMVGEGMAVQAEKDVFRYRHNYYGVLSTDPVLKL